VPKPAAEMRQEGGARSVWSLLGLDSPADRAQARLLVAAASGAARQPRLFGPGRVADTFTGRFELVALHAALLMRRTGREPGARRLAQAVANRLFASFDEALREIGEGDLSVAKRMKGLARAYFGRLKAYEAALDAGDRNALESALSRNIWNQDAAPFAAALAAYVEAAELALAASPLAALADAAAWPAVPA
jgi:cytochrome b pre-mRNA-processing protein 3